VVVVGGATDHVAVGLDVAHGERGAGECRTGG
jgi:hypothetical protein